MAVKIKKGGALASLSITPLIDVVFLLLIFFLVATRFAEEDRELDVALPSATEAKPLIVEPKFVFVNIDAAGHYYLRDTQCTLKDLRASLSRMALDNPTNQTVVLRADRHCEWNHVAAAIDACHVAGFSKVKPTAAGGGSDVGDQE